MITPRRTLIVLAILLLAVSAAAQKNSLPPITVSVDATEAPRKIFHAHLTIPAHAGDNQLTYPKWIPGEHMPDGPVVDLAGLKFTAGGKPLTWRRDLLDMFTVHVDVPAGVTSVDVALDYLSPARGDFTAGASATAQMTVVSWNTLLLYPKGFNSDDLTYRASLRLPAGWQFGTPLPVTNKGESIEFQPVSLTTLVDSPVIAGAFYRMIPLNEGQTPPAELDIAADSAAALDAPADTIDHYKQLVAEAYKLFGARHYRDYHFLLSLSDHVAHFGLEHHESNDSRTSERGLIDPQEHLMMTGLLPHEYVHSWNGKYRRPADLATPNYDQPMRTDLLWVYEGLTSYLGTVLTGRSSLVTPEQSRDDIALIAANLDHEPGRTWRNLQDTADAAQILYGSPQQWFNWRRGVDFYDEDVLIWLEADTIIRRESNGAKSLDDFCHLFHGGSDTPPLLKPYTFDDVVNALNQVQRYDWRGFLTTRLQSLAPHAPLGGIENSGWRLVYNDTPSELIKAAEARYKFLNFGYSLGLSLKDDGTVVDAVFGLPAAEAGLAPGMKIIAVNGRKFSAEVLHDALKLGKKNSRNLELLAENTEYVKSYTLNYHDGDKYPHLEKIEGKPDMLSEILKSKTK